MAKERISEETLSAMYNRLVAAHKSLQEQIKEKEKCWAEQERQYLHTIDSARALCEMIVAKIPNRDFLGKPFSWSSLSADDLIARAKKAFIEYNADRTEDIRKLEALIHTLQTNNENLQTQLEYQMNSVAPVKQPKKTSGNEISTKTMEEQFGGAVSQQPPQSLPDRTSKNVRDAVKKGNVEVCFVEENSDVSDADALHQAEMAELGTQVQIDAGRPPIQTSKQSRKIKAETIAGTVNQSVMTDVSKIEETLTERRWEIIKAIGSTGIYFAKDILQEIFKKPQEEMSNSDVTKFNLDMHNLFMCGVITKTAVQNPLIPKMTVYTLSSVGAVLYERKYKTKPVDSQTKQIAYDHDNLEHGLGIMTLADLLASSPIFTHVSTDRKNNTLTLKTGDVFVPDIIARTAKYTAYFEYERGTHNTTNIRIKLNKMAVATNYLNIVTPDIKSCEALNKKVLSWIESRGGFGFLPKHTVRITSIKKIQNIIKTGGDVNTPDAWTYSYDLGAKAAPAKEG